MYLDICHILKIPLKLTIHFDLIMIPENSVLKKKKKEHCGSDI